jgi:copper chaperone CopZ
LIVKKHLGIAGMSCDHCRTCVEKALLAVPGVQAAHVDLAAAAALVETDGRASDSALQEAVTNAGFAVTGIR